MILKRFPTAARTSRPKAPPARLRPAHPLSREVTSACDDLDAAYHSNVCSTEEELDEDCSMEDRVEGLANDFQHLTFKDGDIELYDSDDHSESLASDEENSMYYTDSDDEISSYAAEEEDYMADSELGSGASFIEEDDQPANDEGDYEQSSTTTSSLAGDSDSGVEQDTPPIAVLNTSVYDSGSEDVAHETSLKRKASQEIEDGEIVVKSSRKVMLSRSVYDDNVGPSDGSNFAGQSFVTSDLEGRGEVILEKGFMNRAANDYLRNGTFRMVAGIPPA